MRPLSIGEPPGRGEGYCRGAWKGTPFCLFMHLRKGNGPWKRIRQNWWWKKCEPRTSL